MSDKTVAEKARVKPGTTIAIINRVPGIVESLGLPEGVTFVKPADAQLVFLFNFFSSIFIGKRVADLNPWHATTLEWTTPNPPGHGNFGAELPTVQRWPFDFSVPGEKEDFIPQSAPASVPVRH